MEAIAEVWGVSFGLRPSAVEDRNQKAVDRAAKKGIFNLEKAGNSVDCILTHCAPTSIQDVISGGMYEHDVLTEYLETIRQRCSFKTWFFGHYHENKMIGRKYIMLYEMIAALDDYLEPGD